MAKDNRTHKDSVFTDLFYSDRDAKKNLLQLYNALYDEQEDSENLIQLIRLDGTLFMDYKNDAAFTIGNRRIILFEHQSTVSENILLRCLLYIARELESYLPTKVRYKRRRVPIPYPDFFVFYNGTDDAPAESVLKLSGAYTISSDQPALELKVRIININLAKNHKLLHKCPILMEYSRFIDVIRSYDGSDAQLEEAVKQCIQDGILTEYLSRKGSEVINMLIAEYDYETDIKVQREESRAEGIEEGKAEGRAEERNTTLHSVKSLIQDGILSITEAAKRFNLTEQEVQSL